jgi:hypothetical protein
VGKEYSPNPLQGSGKNQPKENSLKLGTNKNIYPFLGIVKKKYPVLRKKTEK